MKESDREQFNVAALRWAQAYRALQECKRLHADMTPAGYEAYCMEELRKEAMRLA